MLKDQVELLSAFHEHGVEFLVVGGHAVNIYTQPRSTKDLDVWVRASEVNSHRVYAALAAYGAPLHGVSPADFQEDSNHYFQIGVEPNRVDVLQTLSGLDFEDAWRNSTHGEMEGIPVRFLSREDLIVNKLSSGRPRDLGDVDELRKFRKGQ